MPGNSFVAHHNGNMGGQKRLERWLTPRAIVEPLGEFDLDPCGAPGHVLAKRTFLLENGEDGLVLPWVGRAWVNPPYNRVAMDAFVARAADHGNSMVLIFSRTETKMFHEQVWDRAQAILFLRGRLTFLTAAGMKPLANAGAASCLIAYGANNVTALERSGLPGKLIHL